MAVSKLVRHGITLLYIVLRCALESVCRYHLMNLATSTLEYCHISVIPLLHYNHESHESPRIDIFLDSWLNRYQFVKFLPVSYIFFVSYEQSGIRGKSFELFKVLATKSRFQKIVVNS